MTATVITNVRVFDGYGLSELKSVCIDNGIFSSTITSGETINGDGATLLPGLIDAHVHLFGIDTLKEVAHWGVTTTLDMASSNPKFVDSFRELHGVADIQSCYFPA